MIDTIELGRKMMSYAYNIDNDAEFNMWCKLAPKLIALGNANKIKKSELSSDELSLANRAYYLLVSCGEIVVK